MSSFALTLRVDHDLAARIDKLVAKLASEQHDAAKITRTSVVTWLIEQGLELTDATKAA